ncbi:hypothetical protein AX14_013879 [Amanita brunnescens Koide BX004]|nr:hypothetical protein AX14_013879 [Amanita brunnescens Koide BX004]
MAFAAGFVFKSCRLPGSRFSPIACPRRGLQTFFGVSRPLGAFPIRDISRVVVQTRAFSRTVPALSTTTPNGAVTSTSLDPGTAAAVDVAGPASISSEILENAISHLPPALQYGDLAAMGLIGWSPAGIVRWSLELINVSTGLPWFWTIVAGSLLWRFALVPLTIAGIRNSARLLPLQSQILKSQAEMKKIREKGDTLALQKHALKMRKLYQDAGVNLGITALSPFVQIPVTLGLFFGVKKMCELPVPQLAHSGLDILPDLTVADPYLALPIALCAAVNLQISVGTAELNLKDRPETGHIMNGLRLLSIMGIWVMSAFPSGLLVSLLVTSTATTIQSLVLQIPAVRRALNIPIVSQELRGKMPSFIDTGRYLVTAWKRKVAEAQTQQRANVRRR